MAQLQGIAIHYPGNRVAGGMIWLGFRLFPVRTFDAEEAGLEFDYLVPSTWDEPSPDDQPHVVLDGIMANVRPSNVGGERARFASVLVTGLEVRSGLDGLLEVQNSRTHGKLRNALIRRLYKATKHEV